MPTIKGTSSVADDHAMAKQLKKTKFSKVFANKVKLEKVNIPVISQWTEKKIAEILGFEDEIVASTAINLFLEPQDGMDPRKAQLSMVGFLGDEQAASFAESLWTLLLDAQDQTSGIPKVILEEKKAQLEKQREEEKRQQQKQQQQQQQQQQQRHPRDNQREPQRRRDEYRRDDGDYGRDHHRRDYDRRGPPPRYPPRPMPGPPPRPPPQHHGFRGAAPAPRQVSPGRAGVDEFGRVVQPDEDDRKPRAYDGDRRHDRRGGGRRYEDDYRRESRYHRDEGRDRRYRDDRRRYDRERYDNYRSRRHSEERRRRRSRSSSSSRSPSRSISRSRSRSSSGSLSRSRSPS